jgi:hypothetical protein
MPAVLLGPLGPSDTTVNAAPNQPPGINSDDVEKQPTIPVLQKLDIEHTIVQDDPRDWSHRRKVYISRLYPIAISCY